MSDAARLVPDDALADTWAALEQRIGSRSPLNQLAVTHALADLLGAQTRLLIAGPEDTPDAGLLALEKSRGPMRAVLAPILSPYSALLCENVRASDVHRGRSPLDALAAGLQAHVQAIALHLPTQFADVRPLQWSGYAASPLYAYRLAVDRMQLGLSSSRVRRTIRDGDDWSVDRAAGSDVLARLVLESYARQERQAPFSRAQYVAFADDLIRANAAEVWSVAPPDGDVEAAGLVVWGDDEVHELVAGSTPGPARTLLIHAIWQEAKARGVATYDLGGANTPSIAEFKRTMGADLVPYIRATWHRPGLARMVARVRPLV